MQLTSRLVPTNFVVRTVGDPLSLSAAVRLEVSRADAMHPAAGIRSMEQVVSSAIARQRFDMLLLGIFAAMALILAAVGIHSVFSTGS